MTNQTLSQEVDDMKRIAELLIPYTFPEVAFEVEQEILLFKQRNIVVDGHKLHVCYSKAKYNEYFVESLQVQSLFSQFLPFSVVCKLGRVFLGYHNLSYVDFFKTNKKVYCWTIRSREGRSLPPDSNNQPGSFEGFEFTHLQPGTVDLF